MIVEDGESTPSAGPGRRPWTSQDLAALDDLVSRVRGQAPDDTADLALALELETAHEELRVAGEEIRVQRDQLEQLLARHRTGTTQRRLVASMLPMPILSTDGAGRIEQANAAAAALLNVPLVRLLGKPMPAFVADGDRGVVRRALSQVGDEPVQLRVGLTPRRSPSVPVTLVLSSASADDETTEVQWTVLAPGTEPVTTRPGVDPLRLATAVASISRLPVGETDVRSLLAGLGRIARSTVDESAVVSVNLGHPREPRQLSSTGEEAAIADGLQIRAGEGPCADAYDDQETVVSDDVRTDPRWPRLASVWAESPVLSVLAVPIVAGDRPAGGLNVYSPTPGAFGESQVEAAEVLALAAGAALEAIEETARLRTLAAQLDQALESRAVIDQAKGIVMARRGCSADDAFAHLARLSQERNVKLRDLARALVEQTAAVTPGVSRGRS